VIFVTILLFYYAKESINRTTHTKNVFVEFSVGFSAELLPYIKML